jgi:serine/threonine protein kinase
MAGTSAPPVPHCRDLTPVGERLASTLYAAHSDRLGQPVTVTVYPALADEDARRRFDRAAANARRLAAHPSVLTVHDWGHGGDGRPWVVTDPQPPETMDTLLRADGPCPVEQALRIGVLVAGALETAHRAGVVHGDLSPARLVVDPRGEPLVADIGLAEFGDFPGFGALHNPIRYFAPPEVLERTGVSPASDVYSLATTVYALLAGGAPHEKPADVTDSNASLLLRILQVEVPPIVRPGEDLDGVEAALIPALAHAVGRRPPRVLDLARSLQVVQRNLGFPVAEPVVIALGDPERPAAMSAVEPGAWPAPVLPEPDEPHLGDTAPQHDPARASGAGLVHLFSDTPPDFTDARYGGTAPAAGQAERVAEVPPGAPDPLRRSPEPPPDPPRRPPEPRPPDRPGRPVEPYRPHDPYGPDEPHPPAAANGDPWAPTNGFRPNGHTQARTTGVPSEGLNGRGNGIRCAPAGDEGERRPVQRPPIDAARGRDARGRPAQSPNAPPGPSAVPPIVPRGRAAGGPATRLGTSADPGARYPSGGDAARSGALPATARTRAGSALDRARQARMRRDADPGAGEPTPAHRVAGAGVTAPAPGTGGAPAAPVIVLIILVVLLTIGVAYMVITGDGTSEPVDEQPGASTPSVTVSLDQA